MGFSTPFYGIVNLRYKGVKINLNPLAKNFILLHVPEGKEGQQHYLHFHALTPLFPWLSKLYSTGTLAMNSTMPLSSQCCLYRFLEEFYTLHPMIKKFKTHARMQKDLPHIFVSSLLGAGLG